MSEFSLYQPAQAALVFQTILNDLTRMGKANPDGLQDLIDNKTESALGKAILRYCSMDYPVLRTQPRAEFDVLRSFCLDGKDGVVIGEISNFFYSLFSHVVEKKTPARKLKSVKFSDLTVKGSANEKFAAEGGAEMASLWQALKNGDRNGFFAKKNIFLTTYGRRARGRHVMLEKWTTGWLIDLLPEEPGQIDPDTQVISLA